MKIEKKWILFLNKKISKSFSCKIKMHASGANENIRLFNQTCLFIPRLSSALSFSFYNLSQMLLCVFLKYYDSLQLEKLFCCLLWFLLTLKYLYVNWKSHVKSLIALKFATIISFISYDKERRISIKKFFFPNKQ